jgi:hypothetical protein
METIADKETPSRWQRLSNVSEADIETIVRAQVPNESYYERLKRQIPSVNDCASYWKTLRQKLLIIYLTPACFYKNALRDVDHNCIHSEHIAGEKVVSWYHETSSNTQLIDTLKMAKNSVRGSRFSDAFLTGLSSSLFDYFMQKKSYAPNNLTVVLPARIEKECKFVVTPEKNLLMVTLRRFWVFSPLYPLCECVKI